MKSRLEPLLPPAPLRSGALVLALILVAGLALRLVFFFQVRGDVLFQRPLLDAAYYHRWALEIAAGDWGGSQRGVFTMSPGYPYFLAVVYALFGASVGTGIFVQLLLGVLCGWLVSELGRRLLSREAGLIGAAVFVLYAPELFFEGTLLKASLINVVNAGALLAATLAMPAGWALSGLLVGYSAHLRPTALLFAPVVAIWLWRRAPRGRLAVALFAAGLLLAVAPVAVRNRVVGGEWVWTTAHGGMNFYTGNSPASRGPYEALPFARSDPEFEQGDFLREARRRSGAELTPAQASRYWYAETWRSIRQDAARAAGLLVKKSVVFLNGYEPPINLDFTFCRQHFGSILSLPLLTFGVLLPLAAFGIARAAPNLLLLGYLAAVFLANAVFFVSSEYRLPVVPVLCVYAGWGLLSLLRDVRERAARRFLITAALVLPLAALATIDVYARLLDLPSFKREVSAKSFYNLGLSLQQAGRDEEALAAYRESARLHPDDAETRNNLGVVLARSGRLAEAVVQFEAAAPGFPDAYGNLGRALMLLGRRREAEESFRKAPH